jgi:DNA-binding GntR family transcriptional regulator
MGATPKLIRKLGREPTALFNVLRERISNHEISPGVKLREQAIADEFRVSRARVRDALTMLENRGLIERIPARGAVVRKLDLAATLQVLDMRELLEGLAARLATLNSMPDHWDDLIALFEASIASQETHTSTSSYVRSYELFRQRILSAASSPTLTDTVAALHDKTKVIMRRVLIVSDRTHRARLEHLQVLKAMHDKDAELAELLRRKTIASARKYLEQYQEVLF